MAFIQPETHTVSTEHTEESTHNAKAIRVVDTDVHPEMPPLEQWIEFLEPAWHERVRRLGTEMPSVFWQNPHGVTRRDAYDEHGKSLAVCPLATKKEHLERYGIDRAILIPGNALNASCHPSPEQSMAIVRATNRYFHERWLKPHTEYYGSIGVSTRDIAASVEEIEYWAGEKKFVQIAMGGGQPMPLGERYFFPLYEAAAKLGLPIAIHPGQEGAGVSTTPTAAGWPSRYIEWHTCLSLSFQAHLVSLLCEGVFEKFPNLKIVLVEGGVAWLPTLMWRLDKNWKALRTEVPWVKKKPSEYLTDHLRITTQPIEEPTDHQHLKQIFNMFDAERMLMFASDFPHWDGDTPAFAVRGFSENFKQRVLGKNALELYQLEKREAL